MKKISRTEAMDEGLIHYFTGQECINGHVSPRYVNNYKCVECSKVRTMKSYQADRTGNRIGRPRKGEIFLPSKRAQKLKKYRENRLATDPLFREKINAYARKWRQNNLERSNEIARGAAIRKRQRAKTSVLYAYGIETPLEVKFK